MITRSSLAAPRLGSIRVVSIRTVSAHRCPGEYSRGGSQHSIILAIRLKILTSIATSVSTNPGDGHRHSQPEARPDQPRVVANTAS